MRKLLNGETLIVPVDSSTRYVRGEDRTPIMPAELKVGDRVGVVVHSPGGDIAQGHDGRSCPPAQGDGRLELARPGMVERETAPLGALSA